MQLTNNLLHTLIIQSLSTAQVYLTGCIIFSVKGKDRKYILMISILKCLIYNVLSTIIYEQKIGIDMWVVGIINMALLMLNFSVIKIITGIEYLKIFFGSVIQELFTMIAVGMPYLLIYGFYNHDFNISNYLDKPLKRYVLLAMVIIIFLIRLSYKVARRFLSDFARKPIKHRKLYMIIVIAEFAWLIFAYFKEVDSIGAWFCGIIQIVFSVFVLYIISCIYRKKMTEKIQWENEKLLCEKSLIQEYYEILDEQIRLNKEFQEDVSKQMKEIEHLIQVNQGNVELEEYLSQLKDKYQQLKHK